MHNTNRVAINISDEKKAIIENALKTFEENLLRDMVTLLADEHRTLPELKDKSLAHVQKILDYTETESRYVPSNMDTDPAKIYFATYKLLGDYYNRLMRIDVPVNYTKLQYGSETLSAVLQYYINVKLCAKENVLGAKEVYEDLKVWFE